MRAVSWLFKAAIMAALPFAIWFLANLPALYARVKLDRSYPALSRYEFEPTPDVVLVGSSMTFRLFEGYFRTPVRNLAISGGSSLTGLAIVASYSSFPRVIFVETDIMSRSIDTALVEQFGTNDSEPFKWFRPVRAAISAIYYRIKYRSEIDNVEQLPKQEPGEYDIAASVEASLKEYSSDQFDRLMGQNTEELQRLVSNLEKRGCRIVFYELPYPGGLGEAHFAVRARTLTRAAFQNEKWLTFDEVDQLRWVDAAHLDERSAIIIAQQIDSFLQAPR
jgi:hypothetical protein